METATFNLGTVLRDARLKRGLSQARLAEKAGISRETVYRLERGRGAHADTLARIATVLGVPRGQLMEQEDFSSNLYGHPRRTPLRARRRELGLTLAHCARAAGVSVATLSRFERGIEHFPALAVVGRSGRATAIHNQGLAEALGFTSTAELTSFWLEAR